MKVLIDKEKCIGCGLCANMAPDIFEMQEDKACVTVDEVPSELEETATETKNSCPVDAISIN